MKSYLWPSLSVLEKHCTEWFNHKYSTTPFIPCVHEPSSYQASEEVDVILVGRLHEEILSFQTWPGDKFRLWSLCSVARKARILIGQMNETEMGLIPRYELFPLTLPARRFPPKKTRWTLVYSGRISSEKGFGTYLRICSELQELGEEVLPIIFGILKQGKSEKEKTEMKEFKNLIEHLNWKFKPEIYVGVSSDDWIKTEMMQPVLFNFSTFINEDFGVSAAQAQQAGWPLLLSNWGAHRDIVGANVRKFLVTDDAFPSAKEILQEMQIDLPLSPAYKEIRGRILNRKELEIKALNLINQGVTPSKDWPLGVLHKTKLIFSGRE